MLAEVSWSLWHNLLHCTWGQKEKHDTYSSTSGHKHTAVHTCVLLLMTSISCSVTTCTTSLRFCNSPSGHCTNLVDGPACNQAPLREAGCTMYCRESDVCMLNFGDIAIIANSCPTLARLWQLHVQLHVLDHPKQDCLYRTSWRSINSHIDALVMHDEVLQNG